MELYAQLYVNIDTKKLRHVASICDRIFTLNEVSLK